MSRSPLNCHQLRQYREKEARVKAYTDRFRAIDFKSSRDSTRSPSSTPSPIFSHASSRKAKSPSTPLSSPPSGEDAKLKSGVVSEQEKNNHSRKRKTIDDEDELPVAKKVKHKATSHDATFQVQKPSVSKTKCSKCKRRDIRARRRRRARGGKRSATLPKNNAPARIAQNLGKRDGPNKWYGTLVKAVASKRRAWKVAAKYKAALIALRREAKRSISDAISRPASPPHSDDIVRRPSPTADENPTGQTENESVATASVEPDHQTIPTMPWNKDSAKAPADVVDLAHGDKLHVLHDSRKRKMDSTDETANGPEAKKVKLDNHLDEKAGLDHGDPLASEDTATSTDTRGVVDTDKKEPGDGIEQTTAAVAESATSSDAEQKAHVAQDALEETGSTAQDHEEAISSNAAQETHITQDALEEPDTSTDGHQEADAQPIPPVSYQGLYNRDQLCYQNATYQCLSSLEGLREHLDQLPWSQAMMQRFVPIIRYASRSSLADLRRKLPQARSSLLITPLIIDLFRRVRDPQRQHPFSAEVLAEFIACIDGEETYNGDSQEDAAAFLSLLIDRLEQEEQHFSQVDTRESTDVHRLFRGEMKEVIQCSGCEHKTEKFQDIRSLSVNIPSTQDSEEQSISLETVITKSFDEEDISGHKCDNCGMIDMTRKTTQLSDVPPYLVVALNRSEMLRDEEGECRFVKIETRVSIPNGKLDLADFCDPLWVSGDATYSICGLVQHVGNGNSSLDEGHYVAVCKGQDGVWRLFDDDRVYELTFAQVQSKFEGAQTLFFERN